TAPAADTLVLMQCRAGADIFSSTDANCEGQQTVTMSGFIYANPPAGQPTMAVYRCTTGVGEHFDSSDVNCEGQHTEARLGYALAKALLTRYYSIYGDHSTGTTTNLPPGYYFEQTLGVIPTVAMPGTV